MLTAVLRDQVSEREFLSLPESLDRIELVDGEVLLSPSPTLLHQSLVLALASQLRAWALMNPPAVVGLAPLDLRLAPNRIVQPDICLFMQPPQGTPISTLPDLVIEVLSTNRSYESITKRVLYAEAGVREYWLVDADECTIEQVAGLRTVRVIHDSFASDLVPGFELSVPALFADAIPSTAG